MGARFMVAVVMAAALAGAGFAGENPLKNAEVGDWAEYKSTGPRGGGTEKTILAAKDGDKATLVVASKRGERPEQQWKQTIDTAAAANLVTQLGGRMAAMLQKKEEGKETVEVAAGKFECDWQLYGPPDPANPSSLKISWCLFVTQYP